MASIDILHPLNGNTVGTTFDVLVAYDLGPSIIRNPVQISCTVAGATPVTPPPNPGTRDTGTSGEITFNFTAPEGTYTVNVTTDPPEFGSDTEENITVLTAPVVRIRTVTGPGGFTRTGLQAAQDNVYEVSGTNTTPVDGDTITIRALKLNPGQDNARGSLLRRVLDRLLGRTKWTPKGAPKTINAEDSGDWSTDFTVNGDDGGHLNFEATRKNGNQVKGISSKGKKSDGTP